jgi:hypothetical protein
MKTTDDLIERELVYSIVGAFFDVYNYYGYGLLENVYVAALRQDRRPASFRARGQIPSIRRYAQGAPAGPLQTPLLTPASIRPIVVA